MISFTQRYKETNIPVETQKPWLEDVKRCEEGPSPNLKPFNPMAPMNLYVSVCVYRVACMSVYLWADESYPMFSAQ